MVRVVAPADLRINRLSERGQVFDPVRDDVHPAEVELDEADFDFTIVNDGSVSQLSDQIEHIVARLQHGA